MSKRLPFVQQMDWGLVYTGNREHLIAAGVVRAGEFPGDPGRPVCGGKLDQERRITRLGKDRFLVHVQERCAAEIARTDQAFATFMQRAATRLDGPEGKR